MERASIEYVTLTFGVNTSHENDLEFVLDAAADRTGRNYYELLAAEVEALLVGDLKDCKQDDYGAYGSVWLNVRCDVEQIDAIKAVVNTAVSKWVRKYRVEQMIPNT